MCVCVCVWFDRRGLSRTRQMERMENGAWRLVHWVALGACVCPPAEHSRASSFLVTMESHVASWHLCAQMGSSTNKHQILSPPVELSEHSRAAKRQAPSTVFQSLYFSIRRLLASLRSNVRQPSILAPPSAKRQAPFSNLFIFLVACSRM